MISIAARTAPTGRLASQAPKVGLPDQPQPAEEPKDSTLLTQLKGGVAAVRAGSVGMVVGGAKGLVRGASELPATARTGARVGAKVLEPLTRALGATWALAMTGVIGSSFVLATMAAPVVGMLQGTAAGTLSKGPFIHGVGKSTGELGVKAGAAVLGACFGTVGAAVGLCTLPTILYPPLGLKLIPETVRRMAKSGLKTGMEIGNAPTVSGIVYLHAAGLGMIGGAMAAAALSTPQGARQSLENLATMASKTKDLGRFADRFAQEGQELGKLASHCAGGILGGLVGGAVGLLAAGGEALVEGVTEAVERGRQGYQSATGQE